MPHLFPKMDLQVILAVGILFLLCSTGKIGPRFQNLFLFQFYFQNISGIFPCHIGKHFHTVELDKTMEILECPTFLCNISKIFPYYGRGPIFQVFHCFMKNENENEMFLFLFCSFFISSGMRSSVREIYKSEGIMGFFV